MKSIKNYLINESKGKPIFCEAPLGYFFVWYSGMDPENNNFRDVYTEISYYLESSDVADVNGFRDTNELMKFISKNEKRFVDIKQVDLGNCYEITVFCGGKSITLDSIDEFDY